MTGETDAQMSIAARNSEVLRMINELSASPHSDEKPTNCQDYHEDETSAFGVFLIGDELVVLCPEHLRAADIYEPDDPRMPKPFFAISELAKAEQGKYIFSYHGPDDGDPSNMLAIMIAPRPAPRAPSRWNRFGDRLLNGKPKT